MNDSNEKKDNKKWRVCHKAAAWNDKNKIVTYQSGKMTSEEAIKKSLEMIAKNQNINVWLEPA